MLGGVRLEARTEESRRVEAHTGGAPPPGRRLTSEVLIDGRTFRPANAARVEAIRLALRDLAHPTAQGEASTR
jgi:hypothetical protein